MATVPETQETVQELRGWLLELRKQTGLSWSELSPKVRVPSGTLNPWANGKYQGDNFGIAAKVRKFREAWDSRQSIEGRVATDPGFLETPTANQILDLLRWGHSGRIVAVSATSGTGKTVACKEYRDRASNVWIATAKPSCQKLKAFLLLVCAALGIEFTRDLPSVLSARISKHLQGSQGLLIIDEAQELSIEAIDEARSWFDETGVGIAFVGDERVVGRLTGVKAPQLARINSRTSMRMNRNGPREDDAVVVAEGWGITDPAILKRLVALSQGPGGLRAMVEVIRVASLTACDEGRDLTVGDIQETWSHMGYDVGALLRGRAK